MNKKYVIGLDFGTQSGRAILVELDGGREICSKEMEYPHGLMDEYLPDASPLDKDYALQNPLDYIEVLGYIIKELLKESKIDSDDIVGLGLDATASTFFPMDGEGRPLSTRPEFRDNPHAYVKLWKHHGAQDLADRITELALERKEEFLDRYGGRVSSEWMLPKIWETYIEAPEVYEAAHSFVEMGDYLVSILTGKLVRGEGMMGYKAFWRKGQGYLDKDFLRALDPGLENLFEEKFKEPIYPIGARAGLLDEEGAKLTGLKLGTPIATANIDAHVAMAGVGITESGKMLMIMGTSNCHLILSREEHLVKGICGIVEDGMIPGYLSYEAGQSCMGDHFEWFIENSLSEEYFKKAASEKMNIHDYLSQEAGKLEVGESGLLVLDWWNGNRSVLVDFNLTGLIIGMTLRTRPEEIYRALIEATAFGTRKIIESFEESGVFVEELYAAGGIAKKNPFLMQIFSDVTGRNIYISGSDQSSALGSAICGAVAAGKERGGYASLKEAASKMSSLEDKIYRPRLENKVLYDRLYEEYKILHDYFGRGENDVMKRLKDIRS